MNGWTKCLAERKRAHGEEHESPRCSQFPNLFVFVAPLLSDFDHHHRLTSFPNIFQAFVLMSFSFSSGERRRREIMCEMNVKLRLWKRWHRGEWGRGLLWRMFAEVRNGTGGGKCTEIDYGSRKMIRLEKCHFLYFWDFRKNSAKYFWNIIFLTDFLWILLNLYDKCFAKTFRLFGPTSNKLCSKDENLIYENVWRYCTCHQGQNGRTRAGT